MRILIIGAGAIGSWLGAYLAQDGNQMTLVGREPAITAISSTGVIVAQPDGKSWSATNIRAVSTIADAMALGASFVSCYEVVILAVKAYSLGQAAQDLKQSLTRLPDIYNEARQPLIVCMQNGIGNEEMLAGYFNKRCIVSAATTSPISTQSPGRVCEERADGALCLAPLLPNTDTDVASIHISISDSLEEARFHQLTLAFRHAGLRVKRYQNYQSLKWSKLLLNMMGNATGAILDIKADELYHDHRILALELKMLLEARQVMQRLKIRSVNLPHYPAALLSSAVAFAPRWLVQPILQQRMSTGRGDKRPSLYFDVFNMTGQSEMPWLNGAVAEYGGRNGIPTPVNTRLASVVNDLVRGRQNWAEWKGRVDRLISGLSL